VRACTRERDSKRLRVLLQLRVHARLCVCFCGVHRAFGLILSAVLYLLPLHLSRVGVFAIHDLCACVRTLNNLVISILLTYGGIINVMALSDLQQQLAGNDARASKDPHTKRLASSVLEAVY